MVGKWIGGILAAAAFAASLSIAMAETGGVAPTTPPAPTGPPHSCTDYPTEAEKNFVQGTTIVAFTISTDGRPRSIVVARSSGSAELDEAAVACASNWQYIPATSNRTPIAEQWQTAVVWKIESHLPLPAPGSMHNCDDVASEIAERSPRGAASVTFEVGPDGLVTQPMVFQTSGNSATDAALTTCVSKWIYDPAVRNMQTFAFPWGATFRWSARSPLSSAEGGVVPTHICLIDPTAIPDKSFTGTTVLAFTIEKDRSIDQISVSQSSGDDNLDAAAVRCVAHWTYPPGGVGEPTAWPWVAEITWSRAGALAIELPEPLVARFQRAASPSASVK